MANYDRIVLMALRTRLRLYTDGFRSLVKAHSAKHSNFVCLPKTLVYSLIDDLATLTDQAENASTRKYGDYGFRPINDPTMLNYRVDEYRKDDD